MTNLNVTFLIVDDFGTMRKIIKNSLTDLGYSQFVEAVDGHNAYQTLLEMSKTDRPITFIISDWNMPNLSGIDFLKRCRADEMFKNLPFILVTAESEKKNIVEALSCGVTDYLVKPFSPATFKSKLEGAMKKINSAVNVTKVA